jgi:hypothetical protein
MDEIERLKIKHIELEHKIKAGHSHFLSDTDLTKLKKEKLYIKEKIEKLKGH